MAKNPKGKADKTKAAQGKSDLLQIIGEAINTIKTAVEEYQAENPDDDLEEILSGHSGLLPGLGMLRTRELDKFIAFAKEQGTKMPFDAMEMGVLAAGRKDMQNGLAEILNTMKFGKTDCPECGEEMVDRGRGKKNS